MDTIFDKIIRGEIKTTFIYEDKYAVAFHDLNPQAPIHVLVIPRTKFKNITEAQQINTKILGKFLQAIAKTATLLHLDENGYRVVFNCGKNALQTVNYMHAHILGGRQLSWPPG
ncbi:hypothetical protein LSH36_583g01015 [Paralvinella palmiformis]|uniref:HIT domain-containing protein n=1 Tax=Paralvinella palmiformis TaxID=53620 RepID=A0AAD9MWW2_9ANNE|nr:hypothetical protein LSH36_583g01015 [Paralvinella palmiformis]